MVIEPIAPLARAAARDPADVRRLRARLGRPGLSRRPARSGMAAPCSARSPRSCCCPTSNVGIYIAVNSEEGEVVRGLMYELLDHYLGLPRDTWPEKLHAFREQRTAAAIAALHAPAAQPAAIGPSLPLARYAGDYSDPWYGTINVREANGHLNVAFPHTPGLTGDARPLAV